MTAYNGNTPSRPGFGGNINNPSTPSTPTNPGYNADGTPNYEHPDWSYMGGIGWVNKNDWQGPRTHYEDGTPIPDFSYRNKWNPNWSIRLNDIYGFVGQRAGAGRTRLRDDYNYATFNDPFWRTSEGRNWISQAAISGKSLEEINQEMMAMGERADAKREAWAKLREGGANSGSADTSGGMFSQGFNAARNEQKAPQEEEKPTGVASLFASYMKERGM